MPKYRTSGYVADYHTKVKAFDPGPAKETVWRLVLTTVHSVGYEPISLNCLTAPGQDAARRRHAEHLGTDEDMRSGFALVRRTSTRKIPQGNMQRCMPSSYLMRYSIQKAPESPMASSWPQGTMSTACRWPQGTMSTSCIDSSSGTSFVSSNIGLR